MESKLTNHGKAGVTGHLQAEAIDLPQAFFCTAANTPGSALPGKNELFVRVWIS